MNNVYRRRHVINIDMPIKDRRKILCNVFEGVRKLPEGVSRQEACIARTLSDHSKEIEKGRRDREKMRQRRLLAPIKIGEILNGMDRRPKLIQRAYNELIQLQAKGIIVN